MILRVEPQRDPIKFKRQKQTASYHLSSSKIHQKEDLSFERILKRLWVYMAPPSLIKNMYSVYSKWPNSDNMSVPFFFFFYESNSPGMIINLIIKHLLPAAPAHSLVCGHPPETPWLEIGGEWEREGGRDTGGARGRGCGERRAADPVGSPSHCWILSHSETRLRCFSPLKLCDQNKRKQNRRIRPPPPTSPPARLKPSLTPTADQLLRLTFLCFFWRF